MFYALCRHDHACCCLSGILMSTLGPLIAELPPYLIHEMGGSFCPLMLASKLASFAQTHILIYVCVGSRMAVNFTIAKAGSATCSYVSPSCMLHDFTRFSSFIGKVAYIYIYAVRIDASCYVDRGPTCRHTRRYVALHAYARIILLI